MFRTAGSLRPGVGAVCALLAMPGCLPITGDDGDTKPEQVLSATPLFGGDGAELFEVESNDDFRSADRVLMSGPVELVGSIAPTAELDRDLFDLGAVQAGDRVLGTIEIEGTGDVVLGLLDDRERLLAFIDPASQTSGPHEIDITLHEDTGRLYAVAATRYAPAAAVSYRARIEVEPTGSVPLPRAQVVVLHFSGESQVSIGHRAPVDVPPFDAGRIDSRFAGQEQRIISQIVAMVQDDYAGLGVEVYADDDPNIPAGERSVVYFGTFDSRLLGLADNIDPYNAEPSQAAILYTDAFSLFSVLLPSVSQISQALANVASHEAGHLLGLRHTTDASDLMDVTATARQLMLDQWFRVAPLNDAVLPVGFQDAPAMLSWTFGGVLQPLTAAKMLTLQRSAEVTQWADDFDIPRSMLSGCGSATPHDHAAE